MCEDHSLSRCVDTGFENESLSGRGRICLNSAWYAVEAAIAADIPEDRNSGPFSTGAADAVCARAGQAAFV